MGPISGNAPLLFLSSLGLHRSSSHGGLFCSRAIPLPPPCWRLQHVPNDPVLTLLPFRLQALKIPHFRILANFHRGVSSHASSKCRIFRCLHCRRRYGNTRSRRFGTESVLPLLKLLLVSRPCSTLFQFTTVITITCRIRTFSIHPFLLKRF